jgi:hypothetical protein
MTTCHTSPSLKGRYLEACMTAMCRRLAQNTSHNRLIGAQPAIYVIVPACNSDRHELTHYLGVASSGHKSGLRSHKLVSARCPISILEGLLPVVFEVFRSFSASVQTSSSKTVLQH